MREFTIKNIDVIEHASEILAGVKNGSLLTTKSQGRVNTMSIAWGQLGIEWNRMIFTAFVRTQRFTHTLLANSKYFTISIGKGENVGKIISYCGTKSGRDTDKIKDLNLTLVDGISVDVPAIVEMPLTIECNVIYRQLQDKNAISEDVQKRFYPQDKPSDFSGSNRDYHTMFIGEITNAYIIEKL